MSEVLQDFAFGENNVTERNSQRGRTVKLIQKRNELINYVTGTILVASPKFAQKVRVKDIGIYVRTAFSASATYSLAIRRVNDELVNIAGYSDKNNDGFGEASILLDEGDQIVIFKSAGASTDAGAIDINIDGDFV